MEIHVGRSDTISTLFVRLYSLSDTSEPCQTLFGIEREDCGGSQYSVHKSSFFASVHAMYMDCAAMLTSKSSLIASLHAMCIDCTFDVGQEILTLRFRSTSCALTVSSLPARKSSRYALPVVSFTHPTVKDTTATAITSTFHFSPNEM